MICFLDYKLFMLKVISKITNWDVCFVVKMYLEVISKIIVSLLQNNSIK